MESIQVIKKLGKGVFGTTFLVKINGKPRIVKIEKLPDSDINYDTSKALWREIEFSKFSSKYPEHFMQLQSWEIVKDCKHTQGVPKDIIGPFRKFLENKERSTYCSKLTYLPVLDGTATDLIKTLKKNPTERSHKIFFSMIAQVIYAMSLMMKHGYMHTDTHTGNIMYKKTTKKTIKLGKTTIPTYGYQWYIIDYGLVKHKDFDKTKNKNDRDTEKFKLKNRHYDLIVFLLNMIEIPIYGIAFKQKIKLPSTQELIEKIKETDEFLIIKKLVPKLKEPLTLNYSIEMLFLIFYPVKYHEILGIDVQKYKRYIKTYDVNGPIFASMIKNLDKPTKMIEIIKKSVIKKLKS